ncbi:hypothetical protein SMA37_26600, partial [Escherichia coli]|uniref:hypothetical protein n=1 Tax=Escherichia coli TaxID=562 RepID=UPI0030792C85
TQQTGPEKSRWRELLASNDGNQRLATLREPHRRILSRVRCIAWMLIMASCMEATESYKPVTSSRLGVICAETLSAT